VHFYFKKNPPACVNFRAITEVDFPIDLIADSMGKLENRLKWDDGYEQLKIMKEYRMTTQILYVKLKSLLLLGQREILFLAQAYQDPESKIVFLGCASTEHHLVPRNDKVIRIQSHG
jgi:hypothetical protein